MPPIGLPSWPSIHQRFGCNPALSLRVVYKLSRLRDNVAKSRESCTGVVDQRWRLLDEFVHHKVMWQDRPLRTKRRHVSFADRGRVQPPRHPSQPSDREKLGIEEQPLGLGASGRPVNVTERKAWSNSTEWRAPKGGAWWHNA